MAKGPGAGQSRRGRLILWAAFGALMVASTLVWSAGQVAGLVAHGSWPHVSVLFGVVELVRLCTDPGAPVAPGVPGAVGFWPLFVLQAVVIAVLAVTVRRLVDRRRGKTWAPPNAAGPDTYQPFIDVYRRSMQ
jgi:uncharacterized membrane protein YhaH (DUF805 family)